MERIEVTVPAGWELTGDFRRPLKGDCYIISDHEVIVDACGSIGGQRFIVRKAWQPMSWLPEGAWLYQYAADNWFLCKNEPKLHDDSQTYFCASIGSDTVSVSDIVSLRRKLARVGGTMESFIRPPVNCIQIKHEKEIS